MKTLLLLALFGVAVYFGYRYTQNDPAAEIENPVFTEIRVRMPIEGREIEMALFGKMADEGDCRQRAQRVWSNVIEGCTNCTMTINECKAELPQRYARLFDNVPIHSTYVAFTRGQRDERDGRMVIWGVTADEGNMLCEKVRAEFQKRYKGQVECVAGKAG